jgi:hypothetical protein
MRLRHTLTQTLSLKGEGFQRQSPPWMGGDQGEGELIVPTPAPYFTSTVTEALVVAEELIAFNV